VGLQAHHSAAQTAQALPSRVPAQRSRDDERCRLSQVRCHPACEALQHTGGRAGAQEADTAKGHASKRCDGEASRSARPLCIQLPLLCLLPLALLRLLPRLRMRPR
jgi:hypothetical protein